MRYFVIDCPIIINVNVISFCIYIKVTHNWQNRASCVDLFKSSLYTLLYGQWKPCFIISVGLPNVLDQIYFGLSIHTTQIIQWKVSSFWKMNAILNSFFHFGYYISPMFLTLVQFHEHHFSCTESWHVFKTTVLLFSVISRSAFKYVLRLFTVILVVTPDTDITWYPAKHKGRREAVVLYFNKKECKHNRLWKIMIK